MDKNSVIGFILIAAILFGFTFYQSNQAKKQYEAQAIEQARLDSIARMDSVERAAQDSLRAHSDTSAALAAAAAPESVYKDSLLDLAASDSVKTAFYHLENDKVDITFTTKGAQPYAVRLKDYTNYGGSDLYIFKEGMSDYSISVYAGEYIKTSNFNFQLAALTDTSIVMRLPFSNGGYIEQKYSLAKDQYMVDNVLSFVGMESVIPRNVNSFDINWSVVIPRMEKGYKNEAQYSKMDYYFSGDKKPEEAGKGRNADKKIDTRLNWFAFQQQFFSAIMTAPQEFSSGELSVKFFPKDDESHNLMDCKSDMRCDLQNGANVQVPFKFYFGPNRFSTLKSYNNKYEKIIPLGGWLVGWFTRFCIIPMFDFFHRFISNFGLIILLMTIVIKLVVLPFAYKSYSSSAKMQVLKPEIEKINAKYPNQEDALKKQQATMDLYKRAGINQMGGCLPMLFQFPILWAMFRFFPASIELRQQKFLWADDLSAYDSIVNFGVNIPLLGDHISLFALLMAVSMWLYTKISMSGQATDNDPNAAAMKFMSVWFMPIMMFFICNSLSAGLSYYYLLSNLITMLETFVIKKFFVHPEKVLAKLKASEGKPQKKSKWQLRLEEAQKMQQQALKEQQKRR